MTSFTRKILLGLSLGVATGITLGEQARIFQFLVEGFIRLLQMTVLPYVTVSLIAGIGSLNVVKAKRLFLRVGLLSLLLWAMALGAVFLMPLTFPEIQTASFFSTTMVENPPPLDFISLYIPSNPFHSLANSIIPAVVLFSVFLGVALLNIDRKERLIEVLLVLGGALAKANRFVVRLTPLGLFAIAAHTVGTADMDQLERVKIYLVSYGVMALLLALWILPGFVACLTGIPIRRVLNATRDVLITAFMTGDHFIVLPILIERSKELLREHGLPEAEEGSTPDVIVPAFYNFPDAAKLLSLSFVLFAAWYSDTALSLTDYPGLAIAGVATLIGSVNVAIPFLLDLMRIPADTFNLFVATGILNSRFGALTSAMYMVAIALTGAYALTGKLRLSTSRILYYGVVTVGLAVLMVTSLSVSLRAMGGHEYDKDRIAMGMQFLRTPEKPATVLRSLPEDPLPLPHEGASLFDAVRMRGCLRVGYTPDAPPYSFFNMHGDLVGFDVEMAHALSQELGTALEFVPVPRARQAEVVNGGFCDLIIGGVVLTTQNAGQMVISAPYLDETMAFIVPDNRRAEFSSAETVRGAHGMRIAVPSLPGLPAFVRQEFPNVEIVPVQDAEFLSGKLPGVDALVWTAERGSFLTLLHPAFSVAVPQPLHVRVPLGYPVARHDLEFSRFLGTWIDLKKKDGTIQALYDHWILGRDVRPRQPRWSVVRNVLHWTK
jgi:Na+/H+-dicarboxylate symporter/ABC-type amino acid transport substrate-binding protein